VQQAQSEKFSNLEKQIAYYLIFVGNEKIPMSLKPTGLIRDPKFVKDWQVDF
jgi:hypothetical protein